MSEGSFRQGRATRRCRASLRRVLGGFLRPSPCKGKPGAYLDRGIASRPSQACFERPSSKDRRALMAQNPFHHNELQRLGRILGALSAGETDVFTKAFHFATTAPNGGRGHFNMAQLRQELPEYEPTPLMSFARKLESHGLLDIQ